MRLLGKVVGISGAGSGIGRALALLLAKKGATIWVTDVDSSRVQQTLDLLKAQGSKAFGAVLDVTSEQSYRDLVEKMGAIDWWVNNAGISVLGPFLATDVGDLIKQAEVNLNGVILGSRIVGETLPRGGRLINISSLFGVISVPDNATYCATKHAVRALSECLELEWRSAGVSVHCVHPGAVNTRIVDDGVYSEGGIPKRWAERAIKKGVSAEEAAQVILRGVEKNRFRIVIGKDAVWGIRLARLFPERHRAWIAKKMRR